MRILVVEDDEQTAELLQQGMTEEGYAVDVAYTGENGEDLAGSIPYDLVILDIMLPGKDGLEVCRSLRNKKIKTPIMMLTGKITLLDEVKGLDCGADEYLLKPVDAKVLSAKIRALLRKEPDIKNPRLEIGNLILDTVSRQVWQGQKEIALTKKEYAVLEYLVKHPDVMITRTELEQHAWNILLDSSSNIVDQHVKNLRMKLGRENREIIQSVRGIGYRFKVPK